MMLKPVKLRIYYIEVVVLFTIGCFLIVPTGCKQKSNKGQLLVRNIPFNHSEISTQRDEFSIFRQVVTFKTDSSLNVFVEYWANENKKVIFRSDTSWNSNNHSLKLTSLKPETEYSFKLILSNSRFYSESEIQHFTSHYIPVWLDNYYKPKENTVNIDGKILIYQRKSPGVLVLIDSKGEIEWYNVFNSFLKTARYSKNGTFLCILSDPGYKTAYGNHIIDLDYKGDTLVHFQTGTGSFNKIFHHDLLLDDKNNIVVLTLEEREFDLSSIGGKEKDIVAGDGIQIISRKGEIIWEWSVFDVEDPLVDSAILKDKKDWLHANSLCYDKDNNFLISFYKSSQIWKINSQTGELMWKLGVDGDFKMTNESLFYGIHSIHINNKGDVMFFDNGLEKEISRAVSLEIDEQEMTVKIVINAPLPSEFYSPRMGSAYLFNEKEILHCSSNKDKVVATDLCGNVLWQFETGGLTYRVQFIEN